MFFGYYRRAAPDHPQMPLRTISYAKKCPGARLISFRSILSSGAELTGRRCCLIFPPEASYNSSFFQKTLIKAQDSSLKTTLLMSFISLFAWETAAAAQTMNHI